MTTNIDPPDQEPGAPTAEQGTISSKSGTRRRALSRISRELNDSELASGAVQKLLIDEVDRLESENAILADYREQFHQADKTAAVLSQRMKSSVSQEIVSGICYALGGIILGYSPSFWSVQPFGYIALVAGALLIATGIVAMAVKS